MTGNPFPLVGYPLVAPDVVTARTALGLGTSAVADKVAFGAAGVLNASDATLLAHAARHLPGGADPITPNRCRVNNSATQSIPNATLTALTFDSERYDPANMHSTSSNTSRLVAPVAGEYRMGGGVAFAINGTGSRLVQIRINGTTTIVEDTRYTSSSAGRMYIPISTEYHLAANDYAELVVYQDSTAALNSVVDGSDAPEFWMSQFA